MDRPKVNRTDRARQCILQFSVILRILVHMAPLPHRSGIEPPDWPMHDPLTCACIALSQSCLSSSFSFCFWLHLFNFHPLSVSPSHCLLSQSHTLHLTLSLPPFLFSSSNPFYSHLSTNFVSTGPNRNLTSFVNFSAAGPDSRRRILTPASFDSRSSPPAKKKIKAFLTI